MQPIHPESAKPSQLFAKGPDQMLIELPKHSKLATAAGMHLGNITCKVILLFMSDDLLSLQNANVFSMQRQVLI
jgi:hypothetical protein